MYAWGGLPPNKCWTVLQFTAKGTVHKLIYKEWEKGGKGLCVGANYIHWQFLM